MQPVALAPEDELVLACARSELAPETRARVARLTEGTLDWGYVVETAIRHAVAPLVQRALGRAVRDGVVPEAVRDELAALYRASGRRSARLFGALGEVVTAFDRVGVEAIALKDAALAVDVYPERALRPMGDVDVLVRRADYERAAQALAELGFAPRPAADVAYTRRYATGQHFRRASDDVWIDLQWNVAQREWDLYGEGRFTYPVDEMWQGARRFAVDGYELLAPKAEHMLFHLCLHLEGHEYAELVLFSDVVELLRLHGAALDWDELVALSRAHDAASSVYYVLLLTQRLFGVSLPGDVMRALEPPYFRGGVYGPIFGNLTPLHLSLDETRLAASPPQAALDVLERVVRRQTVRALRLDAEVDALATAFLVEGGRLVVLDGSPSPRRFPDPGLAAFGELRAFVLDGDRGRFDAALAGSGYSSAAGGAVKVCAITSADPVLGGDASSLELAVDVVTDLGAALAPGEPALSNRQVALRSVRALRRDDRAARVRLVVFALAPDELVTCLAARLGGRSDGRLFGLCGLVELFRGLRAPVDWRRVESAARAYGVEGEVAAGLAAAAAVLGDVELPPWARAAFPKLLEWARYGPSSLERSPGLRGVYLSVLALLSLDGRRARARYLRRSLLGGPAAQLARDAAVGALRPRERGLRDFAYWLEPRQPQA
jgi:hypothetical protein